MNTFIMESSVVRPATNPYGRLERNSVVGYEGEHNARALVVETTDDLSAYASVSLIIDDLDCGAMTKTTSGSKTVLSLTLTSAMIGASGRKLCQLLMVDSNNTVIAKSSQFVILIKRSNDIERSVEDGVSFIIISEAVTEMAQEAASAAAEEAAADVVAECQTIANTAAGSASAAAQSAAAAQAAAESIVVDSTLDTASTNAIQNKAVAGAISELRADLDAVSDGSFSTQEKRSMLFYILRHALYDLDLTDIINTLESAMQGADTPYTILQRCALDGTQYVDTGLSSELDECTVETTIIRTVDDTKARCILASNNTIYPQLRKTSANGRHVMIKNRGAAMDVGTFDWTTGEPYTLKYDVSTGKVTVNGVEIISSVSDGETASSANYTLFASGGNVSASDNRFIGYFYGLKVSKNGQVIHEYKPAKRNLDNRIGILDTVTMTFLLSATDYDILEG